ncbi:choice-of-anchor tandem repeat GloVer-containing protein [Candidatus Auribacterota bacterium]
MKKRSKIFLIVVCAMAALSIAASVQASSFTLLHSFVNNDTDDGEAPYSSLTLSGDTLYGMTFLGGDSDKGTIFSINTDGGAFTLLHNFLGGANDGEAPRGNLTLSGETLYGMTNNGGTQTRGTIFSIDTAAGAFTVLHIFVGGANDGQDPKGDLTLSGDTFYGMTSSGGDPTKGTIFSIDTAGGGFTLLHEFAGGANDGQSPWGSLTLVDSTLYGMTSNGGPASAGTIFSIDTAGGGFTLLRDFVGGADDGKWPYGSLTFYNGQLYGMTYYGGVSDCGTVFSINTAGGDFTILRKFEGGASDAKRPLSSLTIMAGTIYGMTYYGGDSDIGMVFSLNTAGESYTILHEFVGSPDDGQRPWDNLTLSGGTLYGMTVDGGNSNNGAIFKLGTSEFDYIDTAGTNLSLGFDSGEIDQLAELYYLGKEGSSPDPIDVDDITWNYVDGELPGQSGKSIGDSWEIDGTYYIYLGSGLEGGSGEVPEPNTLGILALGALGVLYWKRRKQKKEGT